MTNKDLGKQPTTVEDVLNTWDEVLHAIAEIVDRYRKIVKFLVVSLIVDVMLTALIGFGAIHFHDLASQYQVVACHTGNAFRTSEKTLWNHVLAITTPKHPDSQQLKVVHDFQNYLNKAMKLRRC